MLKIIISLLKFILLFLIQITTAAYRLLELYPDSQGDGSPFVDAEFYDVIESVPVALLNAPEAYVFGDNPRTDFIWIGGPPE